MVLTRFKDGRVHVRISVMRRLIRSIILSSIGRARKVQHWSNTLKPFTPEFLIWTLPAFSVNWLVNQNKNKQKKKKKKKKKTGLQGWKCLGELMHVLRWLLYQKCFISLLKRGWNVQEKFGPFARQTIRMKCIIFSEKKKKKKKKNIYIYISKGRLL